ncbi:MAG TPA: hypothetical protein ENN80_02930, partial [Candidatus Hydrogenedentes bacterium]|nr:hypothetical protein [Candidatus Hydrogenedentota bacterium]
MSNQKDQARPAKHRKSLIRRLLRWCAIGVLIAALLLATACLGAQTSWAKRGLAAQLSAALSAPPNRSVKIKGISGVLPFVAEVASVSVGDASGPWLEAAHLHLRWSPLALFYKRLHILEVGAHSINLARLPTGAEPPQPHTPREPFAAGKLLSTIANLPSVRVDDARVGRLALDEDVLGEEASFAMHAALHERTLSAQLERFEGPRTAARAEVAVRGSPAVLGVDVRVTEEAGGLFGRLVKAPDDGALDVRLAGEGPLSGWEGRFSGKAWDLARADIDLTLVKHKEQGYTVTADGAVEMEAGLLPKKLAPLLVNENRLRLVAHYAHSGGIDIEQLDAATRIGTLTATASLDEHREQLSAQLAWYSPDVRFFEGLAGRPLQGSARIEAEVRGALFEPEVSASLLFSGPVVDTVRARQLDGAFTVSLLGPLDGGFAGITLDAHGHLDDVLLDDGPEFPAPTVVWSFVAEVPADEPIRIQEAVLAAEGMCVAVHGSVDPGVPKGDLDAHVTIDDLRRLAVVFGRKLEGEAVVHAALSGNGETQSGHVNVNGELGGLGGLPDAVLAAFGERLGLRATVDLEGGAHVTVKEAQIDGASSMRAHGSVDLEAHTFDAQWRLTTADIAPVMTALGNEASGSLEAMGAASGTFGAFATQTVIRSEELSTKDIRLADLSISIEAGELPGAPAGTLEGRAFYK